MKRSGKLWQVGMLVMILLSTTACVPAQKPLYHWGEYEWQIYEMYAKPGQADPGTQLVKINTDIETAQSYGLKVPPGVYAHVGYLYYQQGEQGAAMESMVMEKSLYPESTIFVDGMLGRLQGRSQ